MGHNNKGKWRERQPKIANKARPPFVRCLVYIGAQIIFSIIVYVWILPVFGQRVWRSNDLSTLHEDNNYSEGRESYDVWTHTCKIRAYETYGYSMKTLMKPFKKIKCREKPMLTYVTRSNYIKGGHVLRLKEEALPFYISSETDFVCCYASVTRFTIREDIADKNADNYINVSSCTSFDKEIELGLEEFILVKCFTNILNITSQLQWDSPNVVYKTLHAIVPVKENIHLKYNNLTSKNKPQLSVLMIGYESISRINLYRTMPKTAEFLKLNGFVKLSGYSAIANTSFENIMALLTGLDIPRAKKLCLSNHTSMDECPFIWGDIRDDFVTAYVEDEPKISIFNVKRTGFIQSPTDYYFRPAMLAAHKYLDIQTLESLGVCMGPESTTDHIFNYVLDFTSTFSNSLYFAFIWLKNFSRKLIYEPRAMDDRTVKFFKDLSISKTYNNTVVMFFSDHGMYVGDALSNYQGWIEERSPFLYIRLPEWYKNTEPGKIHNLLQNRNKLISPYDVHVTLKEILNVETNISLTSSNTSIACPHSKSVFSENLSNRTCEDAGIPADCCICLKLIEMPVYDSVIQRAGTYLMNYIERMRRGGQIVNCDSIDFLKVMEAKVEIPFSDYPRVWYDDYFIRVQSYREDVLFESAIRHSYINSYTQNEFTLTEPVYRIGINKSNVCVFKN